MEALPLGNGRMGAIVYGGVENEHFQLNDDTLWSGPPPRDWNNPDARQHLPIVRRLLMEEGKYEEANELTKKMQGPSNESFEPLGNLNLQFSGMRKPSEYRRELNLDSAVMTISFSSDDAHYRREVFCSAQIMYLSCI